MGFDRLREMLLAGGVAPRHVREYLRELSEHFDDLVSGQVANGSSLEAAKACAHTRLGSDDELAAAMLCRREFRSLAARLPLPVFALMPPVVALVAVGLSLCAVSLIGDSYGFIESHLPLLPCSWFKVLATTVVLATNLIYLPMAAAIFVAIAARQRIKLLWPTLATAVLLLFFIHNEVRILPFRTLFDVTIEPVLLPNAFKMMAEHWPSVLAQYFLTVLPLAWLRRHRRSQGRLLNQAM